MAEIVDLIHKFDSQGDGADYFSFVHAWSLEPTAFIYHIGWTGSTLLSNALMANEPS
jgi:hypothetical protein